LNHLWQRFLLASSLIVGLFIGVAVTVFGYSNLTSVDVHWSIFHVTGVPLWSVAVVPLALFLIAGTLYHWMDGLHHFTEHTRHRHLVHELEAEVSSLRGQLDQLLEMPGNSTARLPARKVSPAALPEANGGLDEIVATDHEPIVVEASPVVDAPPTPDVSTKKSRAQRKRVRLESDGAAGGSGSHVDHANVDGMPAESRDIVGREA
jgi:hypothetical protein